MSMLGITEWPEPPGSSSVFFTRTPIAMTVPRRPQGCGDGVVTTVLRPAAVRRDLEPEGAAALRGALDTHPAAVQLDGVLHDGEPQPGPARGARPAAVDPVEALEDAGQVLGRDAAPGVGDGDPDRGGPRVRRDPHRPRIRVLDGIVEQVPERHLHPLPVEHRPESRPHLELEVEPAPRGGLL